MRSGFRIAMRQGTTRLLRDGRNHTIIAYCTRCAAVVLVLSLHSLLLLLLLLRLSVSAVAAVLVVVVHAAVAFVAEVIGDSVAHKAAFPTVIGQAGES